MHWFKAALGFAASAAVKDAYIRPRQMGQLARNYCDRVRKPLLLIHRPGVVGSMTGPPVRAEYTLSKALPVRYPNKSFGAIFATGILEREKHPGAVLGEWKRVADRVIVVVPSWWSPHAWLNPSNRWVIDPSLKMAAPLWDGRRHVHLLEVSDRAYAPRPWRSKSSQASPSATMSPSRMSSPNPSRIPMLSPSLKPTDTQVDPSIYLAASASAPNDDQSPFQDQDAFPISLPIPDLSSAETKPSESSNSVSHLTVLSAQDFGENW